MLHQPSYLIAMSYHSIVDISCLRVFLTKLWVLMLHVPVFLRYTLISVIDIFNSLTNSIRVTFLGYTNLGILQSLQLLLVFGVFNRCSFRHSNARQDPLHSKMILVVWYLVLLGVVSSVESSWSKGKRGMVSLKGNIWISSEEKRGKRSFWKRKF